MAGLGPVWELVASADETLLIASHGDKKIRVWDVESGKCLFTSPGTVFAVSPQSGHLAIAVDEDEVKVYSRTFEVIACRVVRLCEDLAWIDGRNLLAAVTGTSDLRLWDTKSFKDCGKLKDPNQYFGRTSIHSALVASDDGRYVAAGTTDGPIVVWDLGKRETPPKSLDGDRSTGDLLFLGKQNMLLASRGYIELSVWDMERNSKSKTLDDCDVWCMAMMDETSLIVGDSNGRIWKYDIENVIRRALIHSEHFVRSLAILRRKRLIALGCDDGVIRLHRL